jgi:RsiW-degrading membrane proteinase PrsW (M82 family)
LFRLRVLGGDRSGETFPLAPGEVHVLGRGYGARIRFPEDATLSRIHAELAPAGRGWVLRNKSKNGTLVGGVVVLESERLLKGGDEILLGETRLVFEPDPTRTEPDVPFTPAVPVAPPEDAGYDSKGVFHMGWTFIQPALKASTSSVVLLPSLLGAPRRVEKRRFAFFVIVLLGALLGTTILQVTLLRSVWSEAPRALLLAGLLAAVPTAAYLAAFKLLDRNGQVPLRNYLACFFWGATVGCSVSAVLSSVTGEVFSQLAGERTGTLLTTLLAAPVFEEVTKGLAVLVLFLVLHDEFDDAVEGMLLGAASGLGFALIENLVYNARFLAKGMTASSFLWNGSYRALTCALVGHPVYTAMTGLGFGLARELEREKKWRRALPLAGLAVAIAMHALWNGASVLVPRALGKGVRTDILLALIVGGACASFFFSVLLYSLASERRILRDHLQDEVAKGFIEADELATFEELLGREKFVFAGIPRGTYRLRKELRRAQHELAFRKWHLLQGDRAKGSSVDRVLLDARIRIRDARNAINAREGRHAEPGTPTR